MDKLSRFWFWSGHDAGLRAAIDIVKNDDGWQTKDQLITKLRDLVVHNVEPTR